MKNIFDEEESYSEYDLVRQDQDDQQFEPVPQRPSNKRAVQQNYQELEEDFEVETFIDDVAYELDDSDTEIVSEAMVRLEQARLYEMLIKHNLFDGVDANHVALHNVQTEIKNYFVERLQVLLGIKSESVKSTTMRVELPFNKLEVQALKDLAFKLTKGATKEVEERETVEAVSEEVETPVQPKKIKQTSLKPLSSPVRNQPIKEVAQPIKEVTSPPKEVVKKQASQNNVTVNKQKKKVSIPKPQGIMRTPDGEILTEEEIEIARQQLEEEMSRGRGKNPYDMTPEELVERNKTIGGQKKSKKLRGVPMPSPESMEMFYQQKAVNKVSSDQVFGNILQRVLNQE
jgi:hypothetical protein